MTRVEFVFIIRDREGIKRVLSRKTDDVKTLAEVVSLAAWMKSEDLLKDFWIERRRKDFWTIDDNEEDYRIDEPIIVFDLRRINAN